MFIDHPDIHFARLFEKTDGQGTLKRILLLETDVNLAAANKLHRDGRSENLVGYLGYLHTLTEQGFIECDAIAIRDRRGHTYMHCKPAA